MLRTSLRRASSPKVLKSLPFDARTNPYKAKKPWPPDFDRLSTRHQFHLEKKYRRRAKLKYARPNWIKWTKIVQWSSIGIITVYILLIVDRDKGSDQPFHRFREWIQRKTDLMWSTPTDRPKKASDD